MNNTAPLRAARVCDALITHERESMPRHGIRFLRVLLLALFTSLSQADVLQQRVHLIKEMTAGQVTSYELQFTFSQSGAMFDSIEDEILEFLGKSREAGASGARQPAVPKSTHYHMKRQGDRFWVRRLTQTGPDYSQVIGPHSSVLGWESNALWSVRNTWVMVDYDKGRKLVSPPEILRDLRSVDVAEWADVATIAAQLGVPAFSGQVEWSGEKFRVIGSNKAGETITGRLVQNDDRTIRLEMERLPTNINDPAVVHTVVTLEYQDDHEISPSRIFIRDEILLRPGAAPELWTKELANVRMSFTPTWSDAGDSLAWYVANPSEAMTMVVISNGAAYTVIRGGKALAVPDRFSPLSERGGSYPVWAVFLLTVVILFGPALMWIRRKSTTS
jgi:hypothetical protein